MHLTRSVGLILALFMGNVASLYAETAPIKNFHQVSPGIYRGARPEGEGMMYLGRIGIKTDINLEKNKDAIAYERAMADALSIRFISRPMSAIWFPKDKVIDGILAVLADKSNHPVYVHCKHGMDRTGLVIGLHRVLNEGQAPGKAYEEMLGYNFHPILFGLEYYFESRTGYRPWYWEQPSPYLIREALGQW